MRTTRPSTATTVQTRERGEIAAASRFSADAVNWLTDAVEGVHTAVATRVFTAVGPPASAPRAIHDGISRTVYSAVRGGIRGLGFVAAAVADVQPAWREAKPLSESPRAAAVLGAVSGILGDTIAEQYPALDLGLSLRDGGRALPCEKDALAAAFPAAGRHLAVFLHGLCETEAVWWHPSRAHRAAARADDPTVPGLPPPEGWSPPPDAPGVHSLGDQLAAVHGITPVYVRYNSGAHISDTGRRLDVLLEELVEAWPVPVASLTLVGHSMGGLVVRSACHLGSDAGHGWVGRVRHVVYLGAPHLGAPLEKLVNGASWTLALADETRPLATLLRRRSVGVRDLRHGAIATEDWQDRDLDGLGRGELRDVPLLATAQHHVVAAVITRDARHPVGWLLGDLLVRQGSATGRGRRRTVPFVEVLVRTGLTHFDLLTDPKACEHLVSRLDPTAPALVADGSARR